MARHVIWPYKTLDIPRHKPKDTKPPEGITVSTQLPNVIRGGANYQLSEYKDCVCDPHIPDEDCKCR